MYAPKSGEPLCLMRALLKPGAGWIYFQAPVAVDRDGCMLISGGRYVHVLPGGGRTLGEWAGRRARGGDMNSTSSMNSTNKKSTISTT